MAKFIRERVPFSEAISDPLLLKKRFDGLSLPQQVALKSFYGLPLNEQELEHWYVFQGHSLVDSLGYTLSTMPCPYVAKEYEQAWLIWGRRGSKTDTFAATVLAYEATLGGHMEHVREGQEVSMVLVADKLPTAASHLAFVRQALTDSPILSKFIQKDIATQIQFFDGMKIIPASPSIRLARGHAVPVVVMDEVGFWYTDTEAANPDYEVERAVAWSQAQFPNRKRIGTSTPWTKEGLLWKYHNAGTEGIRVQGDQDKAEFKDILVLNATTAQCQNPKISKKFLEKEKVRDPESFERESLARFVDSISGFFSTDLVMMAVDKGLKEREPLPRPGQTDDLIPHYIAAIDPAFRHDYFAFTIVHSDPEKGIVQDVALRWKGISGQPLNPLDAFNLMAPYLRSYRINVVYSDQYQLESLQQLALDKGFAISGVDFTGRSKAKIFGSLAQLVNQRRIRLVDSPEQVAELISIEKRLGANQNIQISAPSGRHDDMACVLALAVFKAIWLLPSQPPERTNADQSAYQRGMASIERKRNYQQEAW